MRDYVKITDSLLEAVGRLQSQGDERYETVDLQDPDLRSKLLRVALVRVPTLADFDRAVAEIEAETREQIRRDAEFSKQCRERSDNLRVFYVVNTAKRRLTVLARSADCARHFAWVHGHIQCKENGHVLVMKEANEAELRKSGRALGRALRDGHPGVITAIGENVVNEVSKKVYTPMTIVE